MPLDPTLDLALGANQDLAGGAALNDVERRLGRQERRPSPLRGREVVVAGVGSLPSGGGGGWGDLPGSYGPEISLTNVPTDSRILVAASAEFRNPAASVDPQTSLLVLGAVGALDGTTVDLGAGPIPGTVGRILGAGGLWFDAFTGAGAVPGSQVGSSFTGGLLIFRSRTPTVTLTLKYGTTGAAGLGNSDWRNRRLWASVFTPA